MDSNGDLSICIQDVHRITTCRLGRGHIVAATRLQLVVNACISISLDLLEGVDMTGVILVS